MRLTPLLPLVAVVHVAIAASAAAQGARDRAAAQAITAVEAAATFDSVWHRVRRSHYDTAMRGVDWVGVREELRPRAERAATLGALREVLTEMLGRLGESHYAIIPREVDAVLETGAGRPDSSAQPGDAGITVRLLGDQVVVTRVAPKGPGDRAGVKPGWVVDSVGDFTARSAAEAVRRVRGEAARRELLLRLPRRVDAAFSGPAGSAVRAAFRDEAGRRTVTLTRRASPGELIRFPNLPPLMALLEHERVPVPGGSGGCVGVIRFNIWLPQLLDDIDRAMDAVRDCRGVIVDLRGNPGGLGAMVVGVGGHFLDSAVSLGRMRTREAELRYRVNPRRATSTGEPVRPYAGPLAVLVDPLSVSTSELFAAGMQAVRRARVFGETSAGQALPSIASRLPTGDVLQFAAADLVAPDGRRVEGRGVVPDQPVPLRREDLLAGRDAPLDAAIRWIAEHK